MKTLSRDTSLQAERFQIDLIRKAPVYKRLQLVTSLVKTTRYLSWLAICNRYPDETLESRAERFFSLIYNNTRLAQNIKNSLMKRDSQ